jgi:hypothetical protein
VAFEARPGTADRASARCWATMRRPALRGVDDRRRPADLPGSVQLGRQRFRQPPPALGSARFIRAAPGGSGDVHLGMDTMNTAVP